MEHKRHEAANRKKVDGVDYEDINTVKPAIGTFPDASLLLNNQHKMLHRQGTRGQTWVANMLTGKQR